MVLAHLACRDSALAIGKGEIGRIDRGHNVKLKQGGDSLDRRLAQDQDGLGNSAAAQLNTLADRRHREHVGSGRVHDFGALNSSMTISVGFNHATQALTRIQQILIGPRVAAKRPAVNLNPGPAR